MALIGVTEKSPHELIVIIIIRIIGIGIKVIIPVFVVGAINRIFCGCGGGGSWSACSGFWFWFVSWHIYWLIHALIKIKGIIIREFICFIFIFR